MKNLIQAAVVILFAASAAQAQQAVQWKVSDGGNGHWYRIVNLAGTGEVSWQTSRASAISAGGDLATFTSAAETAAFLSLTAGQVRGNPWIGLFQDFSAPDFSEPAGGWRWVSGEDLDWTNWAPGEPNNADSENWANMWIDFGPPGKWNDYRPTNPQGPDGFIVEWSADCNGDGIVDYGQCRDGTLSDYNGNNIPDCCESGTPCVVGSYPVQWPTSLGGNGHWYRLMVPEVRMSQPSAAAMAMASGGHLASMSSASENQRAFEIAAADPSRWVLAWAGATQITGPWIGATYQGGQWAWSDGIPWSFTSWLPNEPNYLSFETAVLFGSPVGTGPSNRWNNIDPAYLNWGLVVEWSADCNGDGVVDYGQILRGQLVDLNDDGVPDDCQQPTCVDADIYRDFNVNGADLGILLSQWGTNTPLTESDLNADGAVDGVDLGILLSFWGPCP